MSIRKTLVPAMIGLCALTSALTPVAYAKASVEDFASQTSILNMRVSPDGKHIAYLVAQNKRGDYAIEVRDTNNLKRKPVRLGSKIMDIRQVRWLNSERLLVNFRQKVRDQVEGQNQGVFENKRAIVNSNGKGRWVELYDDLSFESSLPNEKDYVLVRTSKFNQSDNNKIRAKGLSIDNLRARDFYKMNIRTGALAKYMDGQSGNTYFLDSEGNVRLYTKGRPGSSGVFEYFSKKSDGSWENFYTDRDKDSVGTFTILGFDPDNANKIFVAAKRNDDVAAVYEYNLNTKSFGEQILKIPGQDIESAELSDKYADGAKVTGFNYYNKKGLRAKTFIDGDMSALYKSLKSAFKGKEVSVTGVSDDSQVITFHTTSWDDPGTYYMMNAKGVQSIGKQFPELSKDELSEQRYISYTSRDGKKIPAYITIPKGKGPHPVIVMPHGGPWVSYRPGPYDEWSQLLAANGYLVIDPLFRGTKGLGSQHYTSAFGEWGKKMSDDMDDGITYLARQGLVDPKRAAMFGWSFGGYSAFAASIRSPQVYQCVIPGAGVSDPERFRAFFTKFRGGRELLEKGYAGLIPVDKTAEVSVPMLIVHGELDQRVRIVHSELFRNGLKKNGKNFKYLELKGADHFYSTLTYDHRVKMYNAMLDFLKNDCGPGGL